MDMKLHYAVVALSVMTMHAQVRVKTAAGVLEGEEVSGVRAFRGVPFAAPPVGDLRFAQPAPVKPWKGVREAKKFGPRCMQLPLFGDMNFRSNGMGEDCLYLNVWTPAKKAGEKLPVLVYYYGGGFQAGDGSEPRYDGESMARKGIVALTVNYRLGIFGFLAHPELTAASPNHASGNWAYYDQNAALKWVKANIAAFGGDPNKVTIAGESAGSFSVSAQMASPLSQGLIAGAIGESGSILSGMGATPLKSAEETAVKFMAGLGVKTIAELRAMPAEKIMEALKKPGTPWFTSCIDGHFLPEHAAEIYAAGKHVKVPLLAGWNSEEGNARGILGRDAMTVENYRKGVERRFKVDAVEVLRVYAPASDAEVERVARELASDQFIGYGTWKWIDLAAKTGGKPVYRYYYERPRPKMTAEFAGATPGLAGGVTRGGNTNTPPPPPAKGAVHSAEIEYAMGNLPSNKVYAWEADDFAVSKQMQEYFANFIKTGNPNGAGLPEWPSLTGKDPAPVMHIDVKSRVEPETNRERYVVMEKILK